MVIAEYRSKILIAGVGNLLMRDDGIGVHVVKEILKEPPLGVEVVDVGTAILHALPCLERAEKILVIDAVRTGNEPGTICFFDGHSAGEAVRTPSLHSMGISSAIRLLSPLVSRAKITVLGVEPEIIGYGTELSPRLQAVLPEVVSAAYAIVAAWSTAASRDLCFDEEVAGSRARSQS
jgi:hydrogenase maturation protease